MVQIVKLLDPPVVINLSGYEPTGAYNNSTAYSIGQGVSYNGSSYVCIQDTTGNLPTNTTYWQLGAAMGESGQDGREVELQIANGYVQWRHVNDVSWTNLIPLTSITGPSGNNGDTGASGVGITSITLMNSDSLVDHYSITYTDASKSYFNVTNGAKGADGANGANGSDGKTPYIQSGNWWVNGVDTGIKAEGIDGTNGTSIVWAGEWQQPYAYHINEVVTHAGSAYICLVSHNSNDYAVFDEALGDSRWSLIVSKGEPGTNGDTPHINLDTMTWIIGGIDTTISAIGVTGSDGAAGDTYHTTITTGIELPQDLGTYSYTLDSAISITTGQCFLIFNTESAYMVVRATSGDGALNTQLDCTILKVVGSGTFDYVKVSLTGEIGASGQTDISGLVPYTGATSDLNLEGFALRTNTVSASSGYPLDLTGGDGAVDGAGSGCNLVGGNGGELSVETGTDGGGVNVTLGQGVGTGANGKFYINSGNQVGVAILDVDSLSGPHTFVLPDKDGTVAVTSDLENYSLTSHDHAGVYAPILTEDENYVTDKEKSALHAPGSDDQTSITITTTPTTQTGDGVKVSMEYGESITTGDLLYYKSDSKVYKANATSIATGKLPAIAIALSTASIGLNDVLLIGSYKDSAKWVDGTILTVGGMCYMSATDGGITQTQPSSTDNIIQPVGIAIATDTIYFKPDLTYITRI